MEDRGRVLPQCPPASPGLGSAAPAVARDHQHRGSPCPRQRPGRISKAEQVRRDPCPLRLPASAPSDLHQPHQPRPPRRASRTDRAPPDRQGLSARDLARHHRAASRRPDPGRGARAPAHGPDPPTQRRRPRPAPTVSSRSAAPTSESYFGAAASHSTASEWTATSRKPSPTGPIRCTWPCSSGSAMPPRSASHTKHDFSWRPGSVPARAALAVNGDRLVGTFRSVNSS